MITVRGDTWKANFPSLHQTYFSHARNILKSNISGKEKKDQLSGFFLRNFKKKIRKTLSYYKEVFLKENFRWTVRIQ